MKALRVILVAGFLIGCALLPFGQAMAAELDPSFGDQGTVSTSLGQHEDRALACLLQPDGKILVGGSSSDASALDFALARYNSDGSLDKGFNGFGQVLTAVGSGDDAVTALALDGEGRIVAGGFTSSATDQDFALVRYLPDGSLDRTFGLDGILVTPVGNGDDEIAAVVCNEDGTLLVAGHAEGSAGRVVVLARYLENGAPDTSFGVEGQELIGIGSDAVGHDMAVTKNGQIVVSGTWSDGVQPGVMLLRFTAKGVLDEAFGDGGMVAVPKSVGPSEGFGLVVRQNGGVLVAGSVGNEGQRDAALFAFTRNGGVDTSLGIDGVLITSTSTEDDVLFAVAEDEFPVAAGYTRTADGLQFLQVSYPASVAGSSAGSGTGAQANKAAAPVTLRIAALQVEESYEDYRDQQETSGQQDLAVKTLTTAFGAGDAVSYDMLLQEDGKVVAAGYSEENGVSGFALARYIDETNRNAAVQSESGSGFITTVEPFDVTRTTAQTGGFIEENGETFTKRGVVFSTAPYPVLKDDSASNGSGTDTEGPSITSTGPSGTLVAGTTSTTMTVETDVNASCRYSSTSGTDFDSMSLFSSTGGTSHSQELTGLEDGKEYTYHILCQDDAGLLSGEATVSFSVASTTASGSLRRLPGMLGDFLVPHALAADTTRAASSSTSTGESTSASSSSKPHVFTMKPDDKQWVTEGATSDGSGTGRYSSVLEDLQPGTFYYVRAYAVSSSGAVYYGNQAGFRTADSCFIATAAYGSILHPHVQLLRDFRDSVLLQSQAGQWLVSRYYALSPGIADVIAAHRALRGGVQVFLLPLIALAWMVQQIGVAGCGLVCVLVVAPWLLHRYSWMRA